MLEAKANWLGKKNLESKVRGTFQLSTGWGAGIGADQMASWQCGSRVWPRFNFLASGA
jgi:hypothetical protein